jgi:hypothetical protein
VGSSLRGSNGSSAFDNREVLVLARFRNDPLVGNVLALIALCGVVGIGTAYAAGLKPNSVKSRHIKDRQVKLQDLSPQVATHAYSFIAPANAMPDALTSEAGNPLATLNIPRAGDYVINARLEAFNSGSDSDADQCTLGNGTSGVDLYQLDQINFDVAATTADNSEVVALQSVTHFDAPGVVTLSCSDGGDGAVEVGSLKVTAVRVAGLTE